MCNFLSKLFFSWYPSKAKTARTAEGRRLRKSMIAALVVHIILFFFSFAVVGFNSMILNLTMSMWTYSITLTLRERQTVFYLIILSIGVIEGIMSLLFDTLGNLQVLGKMINVVIYIVIVYLVAKNYYIFRKQGGLHGVRIDEDLLEDRIVKKTKDVAKKAAKGAEDLAVKAEKKIDKKLNELEKGSKDKSNKV